MSPRISLKKTTPLRSNRCSSTDRASRRLMIQLSSATPPPESDLDDEQIRTMLASPLYAQERESSADRSRVYHSFRENSVSSSSHLREGAVKAAAAFSHKRKSSQETLPLNKYTSRAHVSVMRILLAGLFQPVVTVVEVVTATLSRTDSTQTRGSSTT